MYTFGHPQWSGRNGARTREGEVSSLLEPALRFKTLACGRVGYARVSGPLDLGAKVPLKEQAQRLLDAGCRTLVLDLSRVPFVDSDGVRALLTLREAMEKRRARLRVVVPSGSPVERTLRLLRFETLFSIFDSASAAWKRNLSHGAGEPENVIVDR